LAAAAEQPLTTVFRYANFSDVSGLTFNGNAQQLNSVILLSPATYYQEGTVWYTNQVNVAQGFSTHFTFRIYPGPSSFETADGIAFVIQNSGLNALGNADGEPGYENISNSLAVEFDTFQNQHLSDPNNNHIGIQSCGVAPNSLDHASSCNLGLQPNLPITLADGMQHQVSIGYRPGVSGAAGVLVIVVDNQPVLNSRVDLSTLLALNGNDAWVGFTGGTGGYFETAEIVNWSFSSVGAAAPVAPRQ
jgi:hypothetical protein